MALVFDIDMMSTPPSRHVNQTALIVIIYGRVPCKYWPDRFSKAYQLAISHCSNKRWCETGKIMFVVRMVQVQHFASVYYGVCNEHLLVVQGELITYGQCGRVVRPTLKVAEVGGSCPCETQLLE